MGFDSTGGADDLRWDETPIREAMKWKETDWGVWSESLAQASWPKDIAIREDIDNAAQHFFDALNEASKDTVPTSQVCQRSRPIYTADLEALRQQVNQARGRARSGDTADAERFQLRHELGRMSKGAARTAHRERVKKPRKTLMVSRDYLSKADILRRSLSPPVPQANTRDIDARDGRYPQPHQTPPITAKEIRDAIDRAAPDKAPGPDGIPNLAIQRAIQVPGVLTFLTNLFNACLNAGYCSLLFHESTTVVHEARRRDDRVASLLTFDASGPSILSLINGSSTASECDGHTTPLSQEGDMGRSPVATGIPHGSPLSTILHPFYNADIIDRIHAAAPGYVLVTGYIDDVCILIWSPSAVENCRLLQRLHQKAEVWARRHASAFAPAKYGLIHLWKKGPGAREPSIPTDIPLILHDVVVKPTSLLRYLGVELDENLTGCAQIDRCRKKAATLIAALRSIAGMTWGVNTLNLRQMWTAVLLPQIAFACSAWRTEGAYGMKGYQALYKIAGAFRTTSLSALEICLLVQPAAITMQRLEPRRPIAPSSLCYSGLNNTSKRKESTSRSSSASAPSPSHRSGSRLRPIAPTKEKAITEHNQVIRAAYRSNTAIGYTDRSGTANGVGAAAATSRAELEGNRLALHLYLRHDDRRNIFSPCTATIFTDNRAAILACSYPRRNSAQSVVREISFLVEALRDAGCHVRIRWIPGHQGVPGNERADNMTNDAANAPSAASPPTILLAGCRTNYEGSLSSDGHSNGRTASTARTRANCSGTHERHLKATRKN
ncbi:reverse transcriptase [Penicillium sp. IBT 18751x]|nr:reverse transcriptase [Penicillium sp. IBT 18751x]